MDPVKMTVTPPPTRRHRHRGSSGRRGHRPAAWAPDTDDEKPPRRHPAVCSHNWGHPEDWEVFQSTQGLWAPWAREAMEPLPHAIRFQQTVEGNPLKTEMRSELGLEAYVYPVNPPPPSPQGLSHDTCGPGAGAQAEPEQCPPAPAAPPPAQGPAIVPDMPRRPSSGRVLYDARDVRRRLRELTREVEALSHCYPLLSKSSDAEGAGKDWVYHSLTERHPGSTSSRRRLRAPRSRGDVSLPRSQPGPAEPPRLLSFPREPVRIFHPQSAGKARPDPTARHLGSPAHAPTYTCTRPQPREGEPREGGMDGPFVSHLLLGSFESGLPSAAVGLLGVWRLEGKHPSALAFISAELLLKQTSDLRSPGPHFHGPPALSLV
ncbi:spermatid maturation protein 1 isoform X1 [Crocuta crocuta]